MFAGICRNPLFLPKAAQFLLESLNAFVWPVRHGQLAAGNVVNEPPPGRFAPALAAHLACNAHEGLPVNFIQFQ
jgi:hypothetical protein